jgi:hypothetical protein
MKKTIGILMVLVLACSSFLFFNTTTATTETRANTSVKMNPNSDLWWLKGYPVTETEDRMLDMGTKIAALLEQPNDNIFKQLFGSSYINSANNTQFIMVTDDSEVAKETMLKLLQPNEGVKVIFKKCDYSQSDLLKFCKLITDSSTSLKTEGISITSIGISENATIEIGLNTLDDKSIDTFLSSVPIEIPHIILVLDTITCEANGRQDAFSNMIGGIYVWAHTSGQIGNAGTIGFTGTDSQGHKGILTAAHVADTLTQNVYQPNTMDATHHIGVTAHRSPSGGYSDAAWVALDSNRTYSKSLYPESGSSSYTVNYKRTYAQMQQGELVRFQGQVSGLITGAINWKGNITTGWAGTLHNQVGFDPDGGFSQNGDSGGPCYSRSYVGDDHWECKAYGIQWGTKSDGGVLTSVCFGPIDGVEHDLGTCNITP